MVEEVYEMGIHSFSDSLGLVALKGPKGVNLTKTYKTKHKKENQYIDPEKKHHQINRYRLNPENQTSKTKSTDTDSKYIESQFSYLTFDKIVYEFTVRSSFLWNSYLF